MRMRLLLFGLLVSGCQSWAKFWLPENDVPPEINPSTIKISPADGATLISSSSVITVTFPVAMKAETVTATTDFACGGNIQLSVNDFYACIPFNSATAATGDTLTFTLTPSVRLDGVQRFKVRVKTGVEGKNGDKLVSDLTQSTGFLSDRAFVFAANESGDQLYQWKFNPVTGILTALTPALLTIAAGDPNQVAIHPGHQFAYLAMSGTMNLRMYTLDQTNGGLTGGIDFTACSSAGPQGLLVHPSGKFLYATCINANYVRALGIGQNGQVTGMINEIFTGAATFPQRLAVTPDGKYLYVTLTGSTGLIALFAIDPNTGALSSLSPAQINLANSPGGILVNAAGSFLYVSADKIFQYALDKNTGLLSALSPAFMSDGGLGITPNGMAFDAGEKFLFSANNGDATPTAASMHVSSWSRNTTTGKITWLSASANALDRMTDVKTDGLGSFVIGLCGGTSQAQVNVYSLNASTGALGGPTTYAMGGFNTARFLTFY